jgi:hypothetical protein
VARIGLNYTPEQLVFVDESAADRRIGRNHGWAPRGQKAVRKAFFVRGQWYVHRIFLFRLFALIFITLQLFYIAGNIIRWNSRT